jgi:glycosyltransferase involved in cell wall biosynthesis
MHFTRNKPKVSIVIVCYNSEKYIKIAIESVRGQKYKNWELIIVNDCSRDATQKIIEKVIANLSVKIVNTTKNITEDVITKVESIPLTGTMDTIT